MSWYHRFRATQINAAVLRILESRHDVEVMDVAIILLPTPYASSERCLLLSFPSSERSFK